MLTDNMLNPGEHTKCELNLVDVGNMEKYNLQVPLEHTDQGNIIED